MVHICYVTGSYSRRDPLMYYRQGLSMVKAGHKVTYIVCDDQPDEISEGIAICSTGFVPKNRREQFLFTKKKVLQLADKVDADIYQISDPEHINVVRHFKKRGKVVIFNMREYYPDMLLKKSYIPKRFRKLASRIYLWLMSHYLKQYGAVFTVTPEIVDLLKQEAHLSNVYLLTNFPIPDNSFSVTKDDYMSRKNTIIYEGTIYSASRQKVFLDALQSIPEVDYLLVGKIDEGNTGIMKHPAWNRVTFVDGFKMEELKGYFAKATISNTLRDFGNRDGSLGVLKIFESMEAALPVIFSDVPLYRSIVEKWHCGVCADPNDMDSVGKAVRYLVEHKEEAYTMGQNGRRAVLEEYNWWEQFRGYQSVIVSLIEKNNRS